MWSSGLSANLGHPIGADFSMARISWMEQGIREYDWMTTVGNTEQQRFSCISDFLQILRYQGLLTML